MLQFDISSLQAQRRYEHSKTEQSKQQRQDIENEISTLLEKQNSLQEFLQENISFVNNWTKETAKKIKKANDIVNEYEEYTNEMARQFVAELQEAMLKALGDIPEAPQIDFEAPVVEFTAYNDEEYEL